MLGEDLLASARLLKATEITFLIQGWVGSGRLKGRRHPRGFAKGERNGVERDEPGYKWSLRTRLCGS